jgi:hypothetical protein
LDICKKRINKVRLISKLCFTWICSTCHKHFLVLSSFMTYHWVCNWSNTTRSTSAPGTAYPSGTPEFTPVFSEIIVAQYLVNCIGGVMVG